MRILLTIFAFVTCLFEVAHADNIVGSLKHAVSPRTGFQLEVHLGQGAPSGPGPSQMSNQASNETKLLEITAPDQVMVTLKQLRDGSLIVGTGQIFADQNRVQLDQVQSVVLKELLVTWQSSQWEVFEFKSFNKLKRYLPVDSDNGDFRLKYVETFDYALAPDHFDTFSIFITDNQHRMMVGTLHLQEQSLLITVYNSQTGQECEKISLSPLLLK